jgi:hypothetical protein
MFIIYTQYLKTIDLVLHEIEKTGRLLKNVHIIQLDNNARENKNKFVMPLCAWIVEIGLAKNIRVAFCPVGHV